MPDCASLAITHIVKRFVVGACGANRMMSSEICLAGAVTDHRAIIYNVRMKRLLFIAYLAAVHAVLIWSLWQGGLLPAFLVPAPAAPPELSEHYWRMREYHAMVDPGVGLGAAVFIGDSHIQGLWTDSVAERSVNYGIGGDTTFGVMQRLHDYASLGRARLVVLAIGGNDPSYRNDGAVIANYRAIRAALPPRGCLVVAVVLPVRESARTELRDRTAHITAINQGMRDVFGDRAAIADANTSLADPDGMLRREYDSGDGVHLSPAGYVVWARSLREAAGRPSACPH